MPFYRPLVLLLALSLPTLALAFDTYRFGDRMISVGDGAARLAELAGQPAYKEPIESVKGAFRGERWQYRIDHKTVTFIIRGARIVEIQEKHD